MGERRAAFGDRAIDVLIAEFNALRAEILAYLSAQAAVVGLGVTGLGVITGLAIGKDGDEELLLAIPPLVAVLVLVHAAGTYRVAKIGDYIRETLWPDLESRVGRLPSWEACIAEQRSRPMAIVKAIIVDFPAMALFLGAGVLVLATADRKFAALWWLGLAMTAVAFVFPMALGTKIRRTSSA